MSLNACIYEDKTCRHFYPITLLRPVCLMRAGILPLYRRIQIHFPDVDQWSFGVRDSLAPLMTEQFRDTPINIAKRGEHDLLLINGRLRNLGDLATQIAAAGKTSRYVAADETVAVLVKADDRNKPPAISTPAQWTEWIKENDADITAVTTTASLYQYPWEVMMDIDSRIAEEYGWLESNFMPPQNVRVHDGVFMVNEGLIQLENDVEIFPGTVLDASSGPIYIGANTTVESHVAIYGPCYIGPNCKVVAGKIAGSSIGHTCRVGGEVEESVFQSYVNKYHAGFIGHSYIGSWVNFGAMTTNSDLKNNYSTIRVSMHGEMIDTGSIKVGSIIGDHTKFGIGTLLNTGINIGISSNIFGAGLITDKEVGSFAWGGSGNYQDYRFDKAIETIKRTCERRHVELSAAEETLLQTISDGSPDEAGALDL